MHIIAFQVSGERMVYSLNGFEIIGYPFGGKINVSVSNLKQNEFQLD